MTIAMVSICTLVLVFGAARKSENARRTQDETPQMQSATPRVQNKTRSFEVTQARRYRDIDGAGPELSFRNGYDKNITAFAVSVNGLIGLPDFLYSESEEHRAIGPGAVYTRGFGNARRQVDHAGAAREDFDIKVLAVVFDDRSSDGDEKAIAYILEERLKSKQLLTRVIELFNRHLNSLRSIDDSVYDELRSRISSLSGSPGNSSDINNVLLWLDQSDRSLNLRERMVGVKQICENLAARL